MNRRVLSNQPQGMLEGCVLWHDYRSPSSPTVRSHSLLMNGLTHWVSTALSPAAFTTQGSLSVWAKMTTPAKQSGSYIPVAGLENAAELCPVISGAGPTLYTSASVKTSDGTAYNASLVSATVAYDQRWFNLTMTWKRNGALLVYYNGALKSTTALPDLALLGTGGNFFFGKGAGIRAKNPLYGYGSDCSLWSAELTAVQVRELVGSGRPGNLLFHSARSSLVVWYGGENESLPAVADLSGNGHTGTAVAGITEETVAPATTSPFCLDRAPAREFMTAALTGDASFDGTLGLVLGGVTSLASVDYSAALSTPYFGASFWVKAVSQDTKVIVQRWNDASNKRAWSLQTKVQSGTCRLVVWVSDNGVNVRKNYYSDKVIGDDVLHHVAVGWDGANLLGWVDGAAITWTKTTDTAMATIFSCDAPVNIGFYTGGYNYLAGSLRSLLVFDRALSSAGALHLIANGT